MNEISLYLITKLTFLAVKSWGMWSGSRFKHLYTGVIHSWSGCRAPDLESPCPALTHYVVVRSVHVTKASLGIFLGAELWWNMISNDNCKTKERTIQSYTRQLLKIREKQLPRILLNTLRENKWQTGRQHLLRIPRPRPIFRGQRNSSKV